MVGNIDSRTAVNGSRFAVECPLTHGNPVEAVFKWTRASDNTTWESRTLLLEKVSYPQDDSKFTCTAFNNMKPTIGSAQEGSDSKSFQLTVWSKLICLCLIF